MVMQGTGKARPFSQNLSVPVYLVSACLVGLKTRYDGKRKPVNACLEFMKGALWVPVCPEQLGGLPTPRTPADLVGGDGYDVLKGNARVVDRNGLDVTEAFLAGAQQVLDIAKMLGVETAILKSKSPSCALNSQTGVSAALLCKHGIEVLEFG